MSTIPTNIHANHFIAMAGSAYLFGLAQANLEINAIFGILMAVFYLGTALFCAAYAIDGVFGEAAGLRNRDPALRLCTPIVLTGVFSALASRFRTEAPAVSARRSPFPCSQATSFFIREVGFFGRGTFPLNPSSGQ